MAKGAKLFIVRKYIKARSAAEAIRKDHTTPPDDVYLDDDWRKSQTDKLADAMGFGVERKGSE